ERLDDDLMIKKVRALIPTLPQTYRAVLTMRYIDDFSIKEIAVALEVSENVVSVRVHRGLARLKELCESTDII
ncbi:MAG: sigma-70 region 4 domain-containing protein, partial [Candidatus Paceibacterota bacterium]